MHHAPSVWPPGVRDLKLDQSVLTRVLHVYTANTAYIESVRPKYTLTMSSEGSVKETPHRKALKVAVSALCSEAGYTHAENSAVETLVEMLQSCELCFV